MQPHRRTFAYRRADDAALLGSYRWPLVPELHRHEELLLERTAAGLLDLDLHRFRALNLSPCARWRGELRWSWSALDDLKVRAHERREWLDALRRAAR